MEQRSGASVEKSSRPPRATRVVLLAERLPLTVKAPILRSSCCFFHLIVAELTDKKYQSKF